MDTAVSELGGLAVRVYLPLHHNEAAPLEDPSTSAAEEPSAATILIADDEPANRTLFSAVLGRHGYNVEVFASGRELIDRLRAAPHTVALVMTDQTMPGIDGVDVVRMVREVRSDLPVVLASGYESVPQIDELSRDEKFAFLTKPFSNDELVTVIANQLGADGPQ